MSTTTTGNYGSKEDEGCESRYKAHKSKVERKIEACVPSGNDGMKPTCADSSGRKKRKTNKKNMRRKVL
jgi:hypothetical protein